MPRTDLYVSISLTLMAISGGFARAQADETFRIYNIDSAVGYDLGRGFDILTSSPRNQCVVIKSVVDHPEFGPESVVFRSYRIENSDQLDRILGISATASIKLGLGGGDISSSYNETLSINSFNLNYIVEASVAQKGKSIDVQDLQDRYKKLLSSGNADAYHRFRTICGDGYISEIPVGGEFKAVIQIATNSRSEAQSVSASIGASYSALSGAASFSSAVKKAAETNEVRIWNFRRGGEGPVPITPDEIASNAANLPISVKQAPVPLQVAVFSYLGILDDPMLPFPSLSKRSAQINKLAELSSQARNQLGDVQFIILHPDQFFGQPTDVFKLSDEKNALVDFRKLVSERADKCVDGDGVCIIDDLQVPSPQARPARR